MSYFCLNTDGNPLMDRPFVEKYRPQDFDQVEGNEEVIECLQRIQQTRIIPNMLFYGPPGTGKTTSIRIISKLLPNNSVLELNASDERGISVVRQTIKEFASTYSRTTKLVILDEVDFMTKDAQNALRRIIEDYSSTTRFCLIANYPKKIIYPILSRFAKLRFSPVRYCESRVLEICRNENIDVVDDGIKFLFKTSYGDMRKVVNDLQGIKKAYGVISKEAVLNFSGWIDECQYKDIFSVFMTGTYDKILSTVRNVMQDKSIDLLNFLYALTDYAIKSKLQNKMLILKLMSDVECRLNKGCSETVQLKGLICIFVLHRDKS